MRLKEKKEKNKIGKQMKKKKSFAAQKMGCADC